MRTVILASVLLLTGCTWVQQSFLGGDKTSDTAGAKVQAATNGADLAITRFTWKAFENYKFWLTPVAWPRQMGEGYFAVAKDGRSWGLTGCSANACAMGTLDSAAAIDVCQTRSGGVPCILFAHDENILVPYSLVD